ncbi:MAG: hypothetical protein IPK16_18100 [Anaerolineales bacterium]|nr:hypothetical protein [Anaerolineales bacterium]
MVTRHRWLWIFVAGMVLASLFLGAAAPALAAEKSIVWDRFDVDIAVNSDGTFDVSEHQGIRFVDGTFTFGYRSIDKRNLAEITDWTVTDASGNVYQQTYGAGEPYTFTVDEQGNAYVIKWYFPETSTPRNLYPRLPCP